jgi:hypothetical protein
MFEIIDIQAMLHTKYITMFLACTQLFTGCNRHTECELLALLVFYIIQNNYLGTRCLVSCIVWKFLIKCLQCHSHLISSCICHVVITDCRKLKSVKFGRAQLAPCSDQISCDVVLLLGIRKSWEFRLYNCNILSRVLVTETGFGLVIGFINRVTVRNYKQLLITLSVITQFTIIFY